ncbi:hypothetical protein J2T12_003377 [Paenibacillus anaericanus]|uniref:ArnT family glycosyltransferase n=1 Tax=Paenibacillus anaericanus TaxID=170367 RepID=UPI00278113FF|nr:glycosyltransferase family 39 protein [Paenibacillus anaericanus]MDQ0089964.1 hypothetical protein [Paenibacillus anaericanus]
MQNKMRVLIKHPHFYHVCIICIFLVAIIIRIFTVDTTRQLRTGSDEFVYHYAAENLLKYGTLSYDRDGTMFNGTLEIQPTTVLSPGYPLFIAIIYSLFNNSTQAVIIIQLILSIICLWFIYKTLSILKLKKPYIIITLLLSSLYPGFLYNIDRMLTEQLFTTLFLIFVYCFLKGMQENSTIIIGISALFLSCATHVRALAFPFLLLACLFLIIYERQHKSQMFKKLSVFIGIVFLFMLPWWIRNWVTFDSFMLFSEAGENPKVWGAVPYFLDMTSTYNQSLNEIIQNNTYSNPMLYYKWRIFGFFQYMWGDLWDENLVHPHTFLRPFLLLQQLIVVPCIAAIPLIIKNCKKDVIFISCIPIGFTLMNMPFHGLPRYVYPSLPLVFILVGVLLEKAGGLIFRKGRNYSPEASPLFSWQHIADCWMRRCYFLFACLFSLILLYSVYIFAYNIGGEMSAYRLSKYMGISHTSLDEKDIITTNKYGTNNLSIENVILSSKNGDDIYKNDLGGPTIIRLKDQSTLDLKSSGIVSEVNLDFQGGYIYDYLTVYWTGTNTPDISEDKVYKFPINSFQRSHKIFIDDNVNSLMIVPAVFSGGSFTLDSIEIFKYEVNKE